MEKGGAPGAPQGSAAPHREDLLLEAAAAEARKERTGGADPREFLINAFISFFCTCMHAFMHACMYMHAFLLPPAIAIATAAFAAFAVAAAADAAAGAEATAEAAGGVTTGEHTMVMKG